MTPAHSRWRGSVSGVRSPVRRCFENPRWRDGIRAALSGRHLAHLVARPNQVFAVMQWGLSGIDRRTARRVPADDPESFGYEDALAPGGGTWRCRKDMLGNWAVGRSSKLALMHCHRSRCCAPERTQLPSRAEAASSRGGRGMFVPQVPPDGT